MRHALAVAVLALVASAPASALDASSFRWERTLEAEAGLASFEPDGPMYEHAATGFGDLRILDSKRRQVPWRPRSVRGDARLQAAQILNAGLQGGAAVALLDFGPERVVRDRIQLDVPLEPFVGRAEIAGSDDRRTFTLLSSTAIYDVRGATRAVSTAVVFPQSDFRYYRIRATGVREITGATAEAVAAAGAPFRRPAQIAVEQRDRATVIDADMRHRGVWVHQLRFASWTPAFDRPVEVSGSMDGKAYFPAGGGRLYRFGEAGETTLPLNSRYRYLRIRIENGDDEPLRGLQLTAHAYRDYILLAPGFRPPYRVLYGGPDVRPEYDFAQLPEVRGTPVPAQLGPERRNEAFEPPADTRSFAKRHPVLVQAALALAAAALAAAGFLALRRRTAE